MDAKIDKANITAQPVLATNVVDNKPERVSLGSLNIGTLLLCHAASQLPFEGIAASLFHAAISGSSWGPIRFSSEVRPQVVFTKPAMQPSAWHALTGAPLVTDAKDVLSICPEGATNTSLVSPEGLEVLKRRVFGKRKPDAYSPNLLILDMTLPSEIGASAALGIVRLFNALRSVEGAAVILVASGGTDARTLQSIAPINDVLHLEPCIPDSDSVMAFKVAAEPFGSLWLNDPAPRMVSLLKAQKDPRWRHEPYLASDPTSRQILRLRAEEKTLDEIGEIVGLDKSSVKRRLDKLRG